jgi:hypothetical protein
MLATKHLKEDWLVAVWLGFFEKVSLFKTTRHA